MTPFSDGASTSYLACMSRNRPRHTTHELLASPTTLSCLRQRSVDWPTQSRSFLAQDGLSQAVAEEDRHCRWLVSQILRRCQARLNIFGRAEARRGADIRHAVTS